MGSSALPPLLDLASLRQAYRQGGLTPSGLVEALTARLEAHPDPALWIHRLSPDRLLAHARRVEAGGWERQPLYGVPFAIKDNIDLEEVPTTAACAPCGYVPPASAAVVQRLLAAGAIPVGKTNLDQFATGLVGTRSPFGTPRNPFKADVIPGGSSSGSAVAVAAGLAAFALGTDTAGSGRVPAALNSVVGLKPTRGALSTRGVVPACRSLDCVSVFSLTCRDALEILRAAEGFDPSDPYSRSRSPAPSWPAAIRVGMPPREQLDFDGDAEAPAAFAAEADRITQLGAVPVDIDFGAFAETAQLLYQGPWLAERWAALRGCHRRHPDAFLPVLRQIVEPGAAITAADAFEGFHRLAALSRRTESEWARMDVLLVPSLPRPYTLEEIAAEPIARNARLGTYTNFVNLLDLSALAVPIGLRRDGVPWGVTLIAPAWREFDLLRLGSRWQAAARAPLGATGLSCPADAVADPAPAPGRTRIAVVGAHLSGLPLNHQLLEQGAHLVWSGATAACYRLYALPQTRPAKPGMVRDEEAGTSIQVEVWDLPTGGFGAIVAGVPPPLAIGSVELSTGERVKGFLCEQHAVRGAVEISRYGGWRAYLAAAAAT